MVKICFSSTANQDINQIDHLCCSHSRAWELYAESILKPTSVFKSTFCNFLQLAAKTCDVTETTILSMGYHAFDRSTWLIRPFPLPSFATQYASTLGGYQGDFYVVTNDASPYSMT